MREKLKNAIKNEKTRSEIIGIGMIMLFIGTSFYLGDAHGRRAATAEVPQLAATDAKLNRIEKAVAGAQNSACEREVVNAAHEPLQLPPITERP